MSSDEIDSLGFIYGRTTAAASLFSVNTAGAADKSHF